jgi:hypothetical protein
MRKHKGCLSLLLLFTAIQYLHAQQWIPVDPAALRSIEAQRVIRPDKFFLAGVTTESLRPVLDRSPREYAEPAARPNIFLLPMPDGSVQRFSITESPVMEAALSAKFPEIRTYSGQGIDDPYATIRLDYNPYFGLSAQVLSPHGRVFVDPFSRGDTEHYISYYSRDYRDPDPVRFTCSVLDEKDPSFLGRTTAAGPCRGTQLYTYRLAVACTGEYAVAATGLPSPTVAQTLAKIVTSVNRVDGVYELEIAVRLLLIGNENLIVFTDPITDPFTGNTSGGTLINESQTVIDANIGDANYDIGHTFSTGGGGLAMPDVVCQTGAKAKGITGRSSPVGDAFDIDYVAHEMGHQFGGNHTFNSITGSCGSGNRNAATSYEVGSGTTIMAYAGICGSDDIQPNSDPYFHTVSFDEIATALSNNAANQAGFCKVTIATGNTLPQITAMNNNGVSIPKNTPFVLTASATDADGDAITYDWEEWDTDNTGGAWDGGSFNNTKPLFKSRIPKTSGSRTFPDIAVILAGYPANPAATMGGLKGETLLSTGGGTRDVQFRLTVRDNRAGGGGVVTGGEGCQAGFTSIFKITMLSTVGPFTVTYPAGGEAWLGGSTQTITWNVASTTAAPVSTANVKILMSTDGGLTYPITLLGSTPNDGTEAVSIPNIATNNNIRIQVMAVGNIFFDISNANSTIVFNGALPVGFMNFTATAKTSQIELQWQTGNEQNNAGFEVQRSEGSAGNFIALGFVPGAGNSQLSQSYIYPDAAVRKNQRYYYRLKQVDIDGHSTYSPTRTAWITDSRLASVTVSPNPAIDRLVISFGNEPTESVSASIMDAAGKQLLKKSFRPAPGGTVDWDIRSLARGIYFVWLQSGSDKEVIKFIKD